MALNTTTARDTYATLSEANAYMAKRLGTTVWDAAGSTDAVKEKALQMAFRSMELLRWGGSVTRNEWGTSTAYALADEVYRGVSGVEETDSWYYCKLAHTSDSSSEPGAGASWSTYWTRMTYKAQWPREYISNLNNDEWDENVIPTDVKNAQAEEALELLTQENDTGISARARLRESGVVEYEIGDLREKYGPAGVSVRYGGQLRSREAYRILRPVVATSFRSVRGL